MYQAYAYDILNQKEQSGSDFDRRDTPQPPLYAATDRLIQALERLERNLESITAPQALPRQDEQLAYLDEENKTLRQENEQLYAAYSTLHDQYGDLQRVASLIHKNLEEPISQITQAINTNH